MTVNGVESGIEAALAVEAPQLLLERFARENNIPEADAREQFEEVKRFLVVCARDRSRGFAPSKEIDGMWHAFLLFTPDYGRFCEMLGGVIHHQPIQEMMHHGYPNTPEEITSLFRHR